MPQKKNPDVAELMRGKTGRVYGDLIALLTVLKGLPLTYNRDMQEDKEPFLDAHDTVAPSLSIMAGMLSELGFNRDRMTRALKAGFLNATELADYLAAKGVPFRQAHHITGAAVAFAEERGLGLEDMSLADLQLFSADIGEDVFTVLSYENAVARRHVPGGTGPESVKISTGKARPPSDTHEKSEVGLSVVWPYLLMKNAYALTCRTLFANHPAPFLVGHRPIFISQ
jgi:argininosuccinate lyase